MAFSQDATTRQAELEREFPGVGVVAVGVDWSVDDLLALQTRVHEELRSVLGDSIVTWTSVDSGVVGIGVGVLTEEVRAEVEERFGNDPICLDGADPSTVPAAGPQSLSGDGWRLLVDPDIWVSRIEPGLPPTWRA